jgi:leucyl-tRNA synthetase
LYFDEHAMIVTDEVPNKDNLKTHTKPHHQKSILTLEFLFNTSVSQICVNRMTTACCYSCASSWPPIVKEFPHMPYRRGIIFIRKWRFYCKIFPVFRTQTFIRACRVPGFLMENKLHLSNCLDLTKDQISEIIMSIQER